MTLLSKEDWEQLDSLLSKVGFGGYYDLTQLLKMTISNLDPSILSNKLYDDLFELVTLLYKLSAIRKNGEEIWLANLKR